MQKRLICGMLALLCLTLAGCGKYRKRDVFAMLRDFEHLGKYEVDRTTMLLRDDTYYAFPLTESGVAYLLTVSTDSYQIPRKLELIFTADSHITTEEAAAAQTAAIAAFTGLPLNICADIVKQLGTDRAEAYFTSGDQSCDAEGYRFAYTSTPLFTAICCTPETATE
ncbi:MAG: hypothetical protein IJ766_10655 [Clostridia bacterium]|nr:hypothetical protein [Clostridia bacterium]